MNEENKTNLENTSNNNEVLSNGGVSEVDHNQNDDNINNIKKSLINEIKYNWNNKLDDLYETVKIFKKIKN